MASKSEDRTRITVTVPRELKERVSQAAAKKDMTIRSYVIDVLETALNGDSKPEPRGRLFTQADLEAINEARRRFKGGIKSEVDSVDLINEARAERTRQLESI